MAEAAKCPACNASIDESHMRTYCLKCRMELPDETKSRLREFQPLVLGAPAAQNAAELAQTGSGSPVASVSPPGGEKVLAYRYAVYPFVGSIKSGFFSTESAATVSEQLKKVINDHANEGWEFVSVEKIDIEVKPGCVGSLFGQRASYITFDQVVFRALS